MASWYDGIPEPRDKNGDLVPLDTQELMFNDETCEVERFLYERACEKWFVRLRDLNFLRDVSECTLPDSWEQLERDAAKDPCGYFDEQRDGGDRCLGCPAYESEACATVMAKDVIRRAKALAGVGRDA